MIEDVLLLVGPQFYKNGGVGVGYVVEFMSMVDELLVKPNIGCCTVIFSKVIQNEKI